MNGAGGLVILLLASLTIISAADAATKIAVGRNRRVSNDERVRAAGTHGVVHQAEAHLAIDPSDPRHLLGGAQEKRLRSGAALANGFYVSDDGGRSWARGLVPGVSTLTGGTYQRVTDPVVALGTGAAAYYCSLALDFAHGVPTRSAILVNASTNGGESWGDPVVVARRQGARFLDKEWLAIDNGAASPRAGALYVAWTEIDTAVMPAVQRVFISRSVDGGLSWSKPVKVSAGNTQAFAPIVMVRPSGRLAVAYLQWPLASSHYSVRVARSADGGRDWSKPRTAVTYLPGEWTKPRTVVTYLPGVAPRIRAGPGLAAAVGPSSDTLYLAWQQSGTHGDRSDIATARSRDGGRHWSRPVRVPDRGRRTPQFTPTIAASGHRLGVLFYERVGLRHPHRYQVSFAQSGTGGQGFGRPIRASPHFNARNAIFDARFGQRFFGDYAGLVQTGKSARAMWVDSRHRPRRGGPSGGNDVFTARIGVP